ncbi:MAG: phenylalanine--tRNA ligase subunit alpha [Candidatus Binatia bacterium]|nr:phenylalanine--tRNA ligase subunit alpha [Candidatus Binatia bacterium]
MPADGPLLSPNETRILVALVDGKERTVEETADAAGLDAAQVRSAIESLKARGFAELTQEDIDRLAMASELGRRFADVGTPEICILRRIEEGATTVPGCQDVAEHDRRAIGTAFGFLKKNGYIEVAAGAVSVADGKGADLDNALSTLRELVKAGEAGLDWDALPEAFRTRYQPRKRGGSDPVVDLRETVTRRYRLTPSGVDAAGPAASALDAPAALTRDMLRTGEWRDILSTTGFRPYQFGDPPVPVVGRRDAYREFLDVVKQKLLSLGFEEMGGSLVETEFWDMDALFLPQFHPAREIHDVYFVDAEGEGYASEEGKADADTISAVAREHEGGGPSGSRGWGYEFDHVRTRRLVLRSQGTVLSARWLSRPDLKIPGKYFGMARCFRYDTVDSTHAPDFFQVEGIVASDRTSFRHLLGLLELFAVEIAGAKKVRFVPAYFPFTEPSVEIHVEHPDLGWMELGGAGIFRPEVTNPHGVDVPVIAWGLGLDRMAMIALGIKDIRELFTNNIPNGLQALRDRGAY